MGYCENGIWIPDYEGDEEPYAGYCGGKSAPDKPPAPPAPPPPPPTTYPLTTRVDPKGSGTVFPLAGVYKAGSVVGLIATAGTGYEFVGWSGNGRVVAPHEPQYYEITMNKAELVVASFVKVAAPTPPPTPPPPKPIPPPTGWEAAHVVTGLAVDVMAAKEMWEAKATLSSLVIEAAAVWQAKEVVQALTVGAAPIWVLEEVVEGLVVDVVAAPDIWVSEEVLQGLIIDGAVGELPEEEEEEGIVWWWILGGVGVATAILIGYAARRG